MAQTASPTVVATYIHDLLVSAKAELGLQDIFLGDRNLIGPTPTVCVIPGTANRTIIGAANRTENRIETYLMIYQGLLADYQKSVEFGGDVADQVMEKVQSDLSLGQGDNALVIYCYCSVNEPGVANRGGDLMYASRLTFESVSRTMLPA